MKINTIKSSSYFLLMLVLLTSCANKPPANPVVKWMSDHAIRLDFVLPDSDFKDLLPLKDVVGDARIVALGEPVHGSKEMFQMKHRMIEYLVSEMGFNILAFECPLAEAYDVNRYVVDGIGDPEKALAGIYYWPWDTQEVLELIKWMRSYNLNPNNKTKVKFYGIDPQDPERAAKVMLDYLSKVDPDFEKKIRSELAILSVPFSNPENVGRRHYIPEEYDASSLNDIQAVLQAFEENKDAYVSLTSLSEWDIVRQHARQLDYFIKSNINEAVDYNKERDLGAAENVKWIMNNEGSGAKAIIWAHNSHVGNSARKTYVMMGHHLRQWYGDQIKIFGFFMNQGEFRALDDGFPALGVMNFTVDSAPAESLEHHMDSAGLSLAILDMQQLPETGEVNDWFSAPQPTQYSWGSFTAGKTQLPLWSYKLNEEFDALVYIKENTPTEAINNADFVHDASLDIKHEQPTNIGFENNQVGEEPSDWVVWSKFKRMGVEFTVTDDNPFEGKHAAMVHRPQGLAYGEIGPNLKQFIDAKPYRGKKIRLRAAARAELAQPSYAFLRLSIDPSLHENIYRGYSPFFDSLDKHRIESNDWKVFEIEADVDVDAYVISYGIYMRDFGTAWLDDVQIEIIE